MSFSPMVAEWVAAYEQETGKRPTEAAVQIADHISKVGRMLTNQGHKDAQQCRKPLDATAMQTLVRWAFHLDPEDDPELVESVAELWMADYIAGYQEGDNT